MPSPEITRGNRLHIAIIGRRNSGKSTLINCLAGQTVAIVSDHPGTTTDPVRHAVEWGPLGPCLLIDTAGFDDTGEVGLQRIGRTRQALQEADAAVFLLPPSPDDLRTEREWAACLRDQDTPFVSIINTGSRKSVPAGWITELAKQGFPDVRLLDARNPQSREQLAGAIAALAPAERLGERLLDGWIREDQLVLLIMPQDKGAPQGRLILPQSQVIRELMARRITTVCTTPEGLPASLLCLSRPPDLIIADSQVLKAVQPFCPPNAVLTSFSILFAAQKGDVRTFAAGTRQIARLGPDSRVLIAETCSHAPAEEDIGRVKIPALLRQRFGETLRCTVCSGSDFPPDLAQYDLIIQCGSCMRNRSFVLNRIRAARRAGIPITNYGMALAFLTGLLDCVALEPPQPGGTAEPAVKPAAEPTALSS